MHGRFAGSSFSHEKRVSFGPVTIIPIPRRGKLSLSLSTIDTETDGDSPLMERDNGVHSSELASVALRNDADALQVAAPPPLMLTEESPHAFLSDSQLSYLQQQHMQSWPHGGTAVVADTPAKLAPHEISAEEEIVRSPLPIRIHRTIAHPPDASCDVKSDPLQLSRNVPADQPDRTPADSLPSSAVAESPRESSTQRFAAALGDFLGYSPSVPLDGKDVVAERIRRCPVSHKGSCTPTLLGVPTTESGSGEAAVNDDNTGTVSAARRKRCREACDVGHGGPPRVARRLAIDEDETEDDCPLKVADEVECVFCGCQAATTPVTLPSCKERKMDVTSAPRKRDHSPAALERSKTLSSTPPGFLRQDGLCFHADCALWCPEVFYDPATQRLQHLADAVERSRDIKCALCRKTGAAIGCACPECQLSFHLPCAESKRQGHGGRRCVTLDRAAFTLWCPIHKPR